MRRSLSRASLWLALVAFLLGTDLAKAQETSVSMGVDEGLRFRSGTNELALHGYAWGRVGVDVDDDDADPTARIPVARLFATGEFFDRKLGLFAQVEFADPELLDLFFDLRISEEVQLRLGQFRTPYSRAFITPLTNIELPTRGIVSDLFRLDRDLGAILMLDPSGDLHIELALVNGATIGDLGEDADAPSVIGRIEKRWGDIAPLDQAPSLVLDDPCGVALGFGAAYSERKTSAATGERIEELAHATVDLAAMSGPWSFHAESFWRGSKNSPRAANAFGVFAQAGLFVVPRQLQLGARAGWITDGPDVQSYEGFVAWYLAPDGTPLAHHLKIVAGYRYDTANPRAGSLADAQSAVIQAQVFF